MLIQILSVDQGVATGIVLVPQDQMLLYKICREEKFNLSQEFCSHIEEFTNTSSYDRWLLIYDWSISLTFDIWLVIKY